MSNVPRKWIAAIVICTSLFIFGLAKLFWLRFESGDLYPPYSSLRGDPLGAQVFYESLNYLQPDSARRNFQPLDRMSVSVDDTLLIIGLPAQGSSFERSAWEHLLGQIAENGGRLVISFSSRAGEKRSRRESSDTDDNQENLQEQGGRDEDNDAAPPDSRGPQDDQRSNQDRECWKGDECNSWMGPWNTLGIEIKPSEAKVFSDTAERAFSSFAALPDLIPWRSPFFFSLNDAAWQKVYQWEEQAVVVARSWGKGSIVMASDSYLFSNEALRNDRLPDLLAWFIQPPRRVTIDEFHNGLVMQPGIANLMHKYRLQGLLVSLLILLILLIWRQTAVFVSKPVEKVQAAYDIQSGSDTSEGLVGLMQQHVRADDLLNVCYEAWHASAAVGRVTEDRLDRVREVVSEYNAHKRRRDIISVYKQIGEQLKQGKL